jgi:hypothetical protein
MLWTIFVILMIFWLLGMISGYVIGGLFFTQKYRGYPISS